jgi:hypothetical protein
LLSHAGFAGRRPEILYLNPHRLDAGAYKVARAPIDDVAHRVQRKRSGVHLARDVIASLAAGSRRRVRLTLVPIDQTERESRMRAARTDSLHTQR